MILFWIIGTIVVTFGIVVVVGAPYVPSLKKDLTIAFDELYLITKDDTVLDIGSGDGVVLRAVAKRGGHAIGYEINPILVAISIMLSHSNPRIQTRLANFWHVEFPKETTIVYAFAVTRDIKRVARKLQRESNRLDKQLFLLSYGSDVPGLTPAKQAGAHHLYSFTPLQVEKPQV